MFDIGLGEFIVIALVALLVFGPDRLPTLARQWRDFMRTVREQASRARADLQDSVGADVAEVASALREADPRRLFDDAQRPPSAGRRPEAPPAPLWDADLP